MQWGNKMKGSSVLQNILKGMSSLQKGCVSLFYSQVGRDKLNKGTFSLQSSRGAESSRQAIEYNYNNKSKSKKQFSTRSQNWLFPATVFLPQYTLSLRFIGQLCSRHSKLGLTKKFGLARQEPCCSWFAGSSQGILEQGSSSCWDHLS